MKEPGSRWPFDSPEHRLIEKYIRVTRLRDNGFVPPNRKSGN